MSEHNIKSELAAAVWKIEVSVGDRISAEDTLIILESMKMEIPVTAPIAGVIQSIPVTEGSTVAEGDTLIVINH